MEAAIGGEIMSEFEINQQVVDQIRKAGGSNGKQFHSGEFVALLDGRVVAVAKDLASTLSTLRTVDPNPKRGMIFEVGEPVLDVIR